MKRTKHKVLATKRVRPPTAYAQGFGGETAKRKENSLDILTQDAISLSEAAREVKVHVGTVHRWRQRGVRGIRLTTIRIGGKIITSHQALTAFIKAIQD